MANGLNKTRPAHEHTFAPEADGEFGVVDVRRIAKMREELNSEYGIGSGRLVSLDEPTNAS